jgi:ribulose-5-phosphate 4-epimerase/fuculose-1-phosphate aldolase
MNEKIRPAPGMQTIFVSRETSQCPLIADMIRLGQRLKDLGLTDADIGILSHDYGKRLLINAKNIDLKKLSQQDVIEIVEYDPLKNVMMVIGGKDPCEETPIHWIIQKARHDINVLLQIKSKQLAARLKGKLPMTDTVKTSIPLEMAKEQLKTLRKGKIILIQDEGVLFAGASMKEIDSLLVHYLGATP